MQELVLGLCAAALGVWLWVCGYHSGNGQPPAPKSPAKPTAEQAFAYAKEWRERRNFLQFEGDELREQ